MKVLLINILFLTSLSALGRYTDFKKFGLEIQGTYAPVILSKDCRPIRITFEDDLAETHSHEYYPETIQVESQDLTTINQVFWPESFDKKSKMLFSREVEPSYPSTLIDSFEVQENNIFRVYSYMLIAGREIKIDCLYKKN